MIHTYSLVNCEIILLDEWNKTEYGFTTIKQCQVGKENTGCKNYG